LAGVVAVARYNASAVLDESPAIKSAIAKSRHVTENKVDSGTSVYGLSTGFGGSGKVVHRVNESSLTRISSLADTRTDKPLLLGHALLQHQFIGLLPASEEPPLTLPLLDPSTATTMPESWVR